MKIYGLYSDKQKCLMAASYNSNGGDFCVDISVSLSNWHPGDDNLWTTPSRASAAQIVARGPAAWYNADYSSPEWDLNYFGRLTVVDLSTYE